MLSDRHGRHLGPAHSPCTEVCLEFRRGRLANVFALLVYAPLLLCLPALLVVGLVFVVVPGGFIVVLGAVYYVLAGFTGLVGFAAAKR